MSSIRPGRVAIGVAGVVIVALAALLSRGAGLRVKTPPSTSVGKPVSTPFPQVSSSINTVTPKSTLTATPGTIRLGRVRSVLAGLGFTSIALGFADFDARFWAAGGGLILAALVVWYGQGLALARLSGGRMRPTTPRQDWARAASHSAGERETPSLEGAPRA
ncbi:hypothetical protein ACXR2T_07865 [Leucobacter sp. HY1910]